MSLGNLELSFQSGSWQSASSVERAFVRYANPEHSPGVVWQHSPENRQSILSVVIPTLDAYRDGYLLELLAQIDSQDFLDFEIIVVRGDPRQGRAINIGAALAQGKYLLTLDDDTALPDPQTFSKLVAIMEAHSGIGIAGGNNVIPTDTSPFVRRVMRQIPRRSWKPVQAITDSDLAEHPCMIMHTEAFKSVGGENELIPRGLDPYLREEFRKMGKKVVVVPGVIYHHLPPDNMKKLLRQFYKNGRQAAYANRHYPQWMYETPSVHGSFRAQMPLALRFLRFPIRLLHALITGKLIWLLCEFTYALGFARDFFVKNTQE
jgi:glycosyltransferase involved in cell wall biosynthesis